MPSSKLDRIVMYRRRSGSAGAANRIRLYLSPWSIARNRCSDPCTVGVVRPAIVAYGAAYVWPPSLLTANIRLTPEVPALLRAPA